jgi:hypothetical protein
MEPAPNATFALLSIANVAPEPLNEGFLALSQSSSPALITRGNCVREKRIS